MTQPISGFSKLSKSEKIDWLINTYFTEAIEARNVLERYWNSDEQLQQLHDEFIENTITNFYLPLGVAPNFKINDRLYAIPMAVEESSVVAAASKAAKYWYERGGFKTRVIDTVKIGHVHFMFDGDPDHLKRFVERHLNALKDSAAGLTAKMEKRGGGLLSMKLVDQTQKLSNYYQLECRFETKDAMGANFINSCLEQYAAELERLAQEELRTSTKENTVEVVMSILSNYVPECLVYAEVSCPVEQLAEPGIEPEHFAEKFVQAVQIAEVEPYRAVTHNKGIMNGIDAVVIATGNDFRAIEAGIHAYAARSGNYRSLTQARIEDGNFRFSIEIPLALGTVGGLTKLHPLVRWCLELLQQPSARELMQIVAVAGLAQNFGALKSLVTTGIQQGHMKMHLLNILNQLNATPDEKEKAVTHFKDVPVSHSAAEALLEKLRNS
ncbi:hydroxymethylglutaryl-CoA reductase, degradative [Croceiramulus getboli]|nr:hydroxymethylglutaryl-CoA reductase, degradative [Flavobacteriaceae bacterium YJPT1-3]